MMGFAPCGACRAYVPSHSGCEHWRGNRLSGRRSAGSQRNKLEYDRAYHQRRTPEQREAKRAKDREYARAARERAAAAVATFRQETEKADGIE